MTSDQKKELARRLIDAKREGPKWREPQASDEASAGPQSMFREMHRKASEHLHEVLVNLHVEFLSEAELTAELEFWETDTGQSIIEKRRKMMQAFTERANAAFEASTESDGSMALAKYSGEGLPSDDS